MLNHKKGQKQSHHEEHEVGNQGIQYMFNHRVHRGHGGKNLSQRIYAGRPHKIH